MMDYITPEKPLESSLFHSLTGAEGLSMMPPEEDNDGEPLDPCTPAEKALIYMWIQQGASLEGIQVAEVEEETRSAIYRLFLFSGYFHPAIVHFPIALITISAVFIILFFKNEALSDDAAFYLLMFGTLSAIVACLFGWGFAERNAVAVTDLSQGINRHRWVAIIATVLALVSTILGWRSRNEIMEKSRSSMWKFGVILTAALMGLTGHQGGEEVYGEGMYERAAVKLIPEFWPFGSDKKEADKKEAESDANESGAANQGDGQPKGQAESDQKNSANGEPQSNNSQSTGDQNQKNEGGQNSQTNGTSDNKQASPPTDPTLNNK